MSVNNYYTLGRSGLRVSRLALGTMTFGTEWGWGADRTTAKTLFDDYVEAGGNFIDTADLYTNGTSETWLGEFIAERNLRDLMVIATKFSYNGEPGNPNAGGNGRKNIMRAVEGSLKRLNTDYIDLYILHTWDRITSAAEVMRTLDDLVRSGKVRYIGLSDVPAWYASRAQTIAELRGYETLSTLQLEYSLVERNIENEFVPFGTEHGMGIMVWSPLASGLLSGKYRPSEDGGMGEGRLEAMKESINPAFQKFSDRNWKIVAELEAVATEVGRSMAQVAVNWAANRPGIASVIIGATKPHQLQDNLQALDFTLSEEHLMRLNQVSTPELKFPYTFFGSEMQAMLHGGVTVGDKPKNYYPVIETSGGGAGVDSDAE
ncbi:aldo/keto reductase [Moorena bouillonii]|uniref:Aldo/keto reductase n=1 Tax=Moorena bouillonii PNG TaxID=568701 RepID=A0A1U7N9V3_9CYAN|nr:aldo/keto reductase [Moorena bouillonii]OLT62694.1 aldo/keto reductase [Moorena bouillonii PNG]